MTTEPSGNAATTHRHHRTPRLATRQSGVVLIVAMVMLVVIGLASVAIMRNTLDSDIISDNNRRQGQALLAAQAAMRYCEALAARSDATLKVLEAVDTPAQEAWSTFSNWTDDSDTGSVKEVDASYLKSSSISEDKAPRPANAPLPQCMAQKRTLPSGEVVVVTARGFSDNYAADSSGRTTSGSVVWLQSIVQFEN